MIGPQVRVQRAAHGPRLSVHRTRGRVEVTHTLGPGEIDNDLAGMLACEVADNATFESAFAAVVESCDPDPLTAWGRFYVNTLDRIEAAWREPGTAHGTVAEFAPVYARALELVPPGDVLDLSSCFGFLPMLMTRRPGYRVIASDIAVGTMRLLDAVARARGLPIAALACDAAHVPLAEACVDTVTVLHLLEHLDADAGRAVVAEAARLARRRVVVAVPFEDEPLAAYGHVRTVDEPALAELGESTGMPFEVSTHHGGWLVVEASRQPC
jgi:SAM-dependent methyltransferase